MLIRKSSVIAGKLIVVFLLSFVARGQDNYLPSYKIEKEIIIIESMNDSVDIAHNFYDYYDSLSIYFPADTLYSCFDNEETHYPLVDFSQKTDTTLIVLTDNSHYKYHHPFCGRVTSKFGKRRYRYHFGTDVDLVTGDTLYCAFDGMVRITRLSSSYGYVVVVRHLNGLETLYAHLSRILVDTDQVLKAGDVIGLGGNTGRSYGSHLHFEIRFLGAPINPQDIIDFDHCCLKNDSLFLSGFNFRYLAEIEEMKKAKYHRIRSGDTLSHIAGRYHTSISRICTLNGISRNTILRIGRSLRVR